LKKREGVIYGKTFEGRLASLSQAQGVLEDFRGAVLEKGRKAESGVPTVLNHQRWRFREREWLKSERVEKATV